MTFEFDLEMTEDSSVRLGAGVGPSEFRLDYTSLTPEDPLSSIPGWTIDQHTGALTKVGGSGFESKASDGQGSMHADVGILDLASQSVYVGTEGITTPGNNQVSMMLTKGHAPGAAWGAAGWGNIDGYLCFINSSGIIVYGCNGTTSYANSGSFGTTGASIAKIEMRVVMGGASNVIQIFVGGTQLGSDWVDNHADRIQGAEVFGTLGCAVRYVTGAGGIIEQIYGGTL